jgi:flagellar biogenesis protein FliO
LGTEQNTTPLPESGQTQTPLRDVQPATDKATVSVSKMLSAAVVVLVLLGLTALAMRKLMPKIVRASGRALAVQESLPLGQGRMLHLVNVGGKKLLIASTKERVSMLADVSSGTGAPSVSSSAWDSQTQSEETHGRDAHATHGQDGRATEEDHGRDAHATEGRE